jgi:hypothetical protein
MTLKHTFLAGLALLSLTVAPSAYAYLTPEDVLLNKELYLPPTKRESDIRVARQSRESAERREREQEVLFGAQHSSESSEEASLPAATSESNSAADTGQLTDEELRLLRTVRLLDRVDRNQNILLYGNRLLPMQVDAAHGGAPLTPTGAGGALSAITMIGAVGWTIWRAKRGKVIIAK